MALSPFYSLLGHYPHSSRRPGAILIPLTAYMYNHPLTAYILYSHHSLPTYYTHITHFLYTIHLTHCRYSIIIYPNHCIPTIRIPIAVCILYTLTPAYIVYTLTHCLYIIHPHSLPTYYTPSLTAYILYSPQSLRI